MYDTSVPESYVIARVLSMNIKVPDYSLGP